MFAILFFAFVSSDWPGFLGPTRNGVAGEHDISRIWGEPGPEIQWSIEMGEGYAGPVIAKDKVYVFDRKGTNARLRCLKAADGGVLWQQTYATDYVDMYGFSNGPRAAPMVDGERVYTLGVEGLLQCRSGSDGSLVWQRDTNAEYGVVQNFFGVGSSPVIYENLIIAMIGGSPADSPDIKSGRTTANGTCVVAFDKLSGAEIYRTGNYLASYASPIITSHSGRSWCLVFARAGLLGLNPDDGREDFFFPWRAWRNETVNASTPVVQGQHVLITESYEKGAAWLKISDSGVAPVRLDDRRNQTMASHWATPIYSQGYLFGCHGEKTSNALLRCIDWNSGQVMWDKPGLGRTSLTLVGDHLLVLSEKGILRLIKADPSGYSELGQLKPVSSPAWNVPAVADGHVFVRGPKRLVCLGPPN